jgi:hypothetical protein
MSPRHQWSRIAFVLYTRKAGQFVTENPPRSHRATNGHLGGFGYRLDFVQFRSFSRPPGRQNVSLKSPVCSRSVPYLTVKMRSRKPLPSMANSSRREVGISVGRQTAQAELYRYRSLGSEKFCLVLNGLFHRCDGCGKVMITRDQRPKRQIGSNQSFGPSWNVDRRIDSLIEGTKEPI